MYIYSSSLVRRTLVTLGKEAESINLADKVNHTCPPSESEANYKNPCHHKYVHTIKPYPPSNA